MNLSKEKYAMKNAPCYIYDKKEIINRCCDLQTAMPHVQFLYSIKANPFKPVVSTIAKHGFGADAASSQEVLTAFHCGISAEHILYSSPGKTDQDIEKAMDKCIFIIDSFHELERLNFQAKKKGKKLSVGVRINPAFSMTSDTLCSSKFGIDENLLDSFFQCAKKMNNLTISGIHIHLQSQILSAEILSRYYKKCYQLAEKISYNFDVKIKFINLGSGIGTVYDEKLDSPVDLGLLAETLEEIDTLNKNGLQAKLFIETGRYITCNAGTYYTRIVDIKESAGIKYLIVENSMNGFLRPSLAALMNKIANTSLTGMEPLYTSKNEFSVLSLITSVNQTEKVTVVGNLCTALDVIASDIMLPSMQIGDVLAISNAGSYAYTLSPLLFSSHSLPKEFLWE